MHPGQYTVLNSLDKDVSQRVAADLFYHCEMLDALGCDAACKIIFHIGGVYSDKIPEAEDALNKAALFIDK